MHMARLQLLLPIKRLLRLLPPTVVLYALLRICLDYFYSRLVIKFVGRGGGADLDAANGLLSFV